MNTELTTATANLLNDLHNLVPQQKQELIDAANRLGVTVVQIGDHIQQLPRGIRMAWLRDNCPSFTHEQIASYLSIAATHKKRPDNAIDHRFFALLGMTEAGSNDNATPSPTKSAIPKWIAWTGKLTGHFSAMLKEKPPNQWDESEKAAVAKQLKPIVEIYQRIVK